MTLSKKVSLSYTLGHGGGMKVAVTDDLKINHTFYISPERYFTKKHIGFYLKNGGSYVIYKSVLIIKRSADFNVRFYLFM